MSPRLPLSISQAEGSNNVSTMYLNTDVLGNVQAGREVSAFPQHKRPLRRHRLETRGFAHTFQSAPLVTS